MRQPARRAVSSLREPGAPRAGAGPVGSVRPQHDRRAHGQGILDQHISLRPRSPEARPVHRARRSCDARVGWPFPRSGSTGEGVRGRRPSTLCPPQRTPDLEVVRASEAHRGRHVGGASAARDQLRAPVDHGIPDLTRLVVAGVSRQQHPALERIGQRSRQRIVTVVISLFSIRSGNSAHRPSRTHPGGPPRSAMASASAVAASPGRNASSESSETVTSIAVAKWARVVSSVSSPPGELSRSGTA
jgi:hypothetical protein